MMKMLLVEDSELIRTRLQAWLRNLVGLNHIITASTLEQALLLVRQECPDLLILDLSLPDGNAINRLKDFKFFAPHMAIAVYSNDASTFTRQKCLQAGAHWFFDKSGEVSDLIALVQQQLRSHMLRSLNNPT